MIVQSAHIPEAHYWHLPFTRYEPLAHSKHVFLLKIFKNILLNKII